MHVVCRISSHSSRQEAKVISSRGVVYASKLRATKRIKFAIQFFRMPCRSHLYFTNFFTAFPHLAIHTHTYIYLVFTCRPQCLLDAWRKRNEDKKTPSYGQPDDRVSPAPAIPLALLPVTAFLLAAHKPFPKCTQTSRTHLPRLPCLWAPAEQQQQHLYTFGQIYVSWQSSLYVRDAVRKAKWKRPLKHLERRPRSLEKVFFAAVYYRKRG